MPPPKTWWTGFSLPNSRQILAFTDDGDASGAAAGFTSESESDEEEEEERSKWILSAIFSMNDSSLCSECCSTCSAIFSVDRSSDSITEQLKQWRRKWDYICGEKEEGPNIRTARYGYYTEPEIKVPHVWGNIFLFSDLKN